VHQVGYLPELYEDACSEKYKILHTTVIKFAKIFLKTLIYLHVSNNVINTQKTNIF